MLKLKKPLFIGSLILSASLSGICSSAFSALAPFYQSLSEIDAVINNPKFTQAAGVNRGIKSITKTGDHYSIILRAKKENENEICTLKGELQGTTSNVTRVIPIFRVNFAEKAKCSSTNEEFSKTNIYTSRRLLREVIHEPRLARLTTNSRRIQSVRQNETGYSITLKGSNDICVVDVKLELIPVFKDMDWPVRSKFNFPTTMDCSLFKSEL